MADKKDQGVLYQIKVLVAGGVAGAVSRTIVSPLERVKIQFQVQDVIASKDGGKLEDKSISQALRRIYAREGWRGFFKGNGTNIVRIVPYSAVQFMVFERLKRLLDPDRKGLTPYERLFSGAVAGGASVAATYPLDLVRSRLTVQGEHTLVQYNGIWDATKKIFHMEGIRGLFKGVNPTLAGVIPYMGLNFAVYETLKAEAITRNGGQPIDVYSSLVCGGIAGACAQTAAYPFDLLRRRFQVDGFSAHQDTGPKKYRGIWQGLRHVVATEGFTGLYKGLTPNYAKVVPTVAVSFATYELMKKLLGIQDARK